MDIKKTVVLSVFLHICFFSAALLLSEGSGKRPETEVVFISLVADESQGVKAATVLEKVRVVKKAEKLPVALKMEPETAITDVAVDKVEELSEDVTPEEVVPVAEEPMSAELFADESIGDNNDHVEEVNIAQAVHDQPVSIGLATTSPPAPAGQGQGLLPATIELISMAIERVKTYPILARKRGIEGTVHVSFNVMADGNPHGIKILKSSGFSILDKATVKVVRKAAPFPLIANRIVLPVAYRLRN